MRTRGIVAAIVLGAVAAPAGAIDVANGQLTVSGFGEWAYGRTWNDNRYYLQEREGELFSLAEKDGSYENAQFSLAVTARPQDDVVVAGQLFVARTGEVSLDWAFAEYRLGDHLRVRAGKVKNPFGLFMEVKDVGTLRPFYTLPQSIYGATDFSAESYVGAGITGEWEARGGWGVAYDAYAGALEIPSFEPGMAVEDAGGVPPFLFAEHPEHEVRAHDVVGGRIGLLTPLDGLTIRLSGYTGKFTQPGEREERIGCFGLSAEYAADRFQIRTEYFRATEGGAEVHVGEYGEVAWNFLPKLQLALRYERGHLEDDTLPGQFTRHHEGAVGLSYWPSPNLVFKASYHRVEGNRFVVPAESTDGIVDEKTDVLIVGVQFSF